MLKYLTFGLFFAAVAAWSQDAPSFAASFDCSQASSEVELAICGDEGLAALDLSLSRIYANRLSKLEDTEAVDDLRNAQLTWMARRDSCEGDEYFLPRCIENAYRKRLNQFEPAKSTIAIIADKTQYVRKSKWTENMVSINYDNSILMDADLAPLVSEAQTEMEASFDGFASFADEDAVRYEEQRDLALVFKTPPLAVITESVWGYYGGAHGSWWGRVRYVDRALGHEIGFADLFLPEHANEVRDGLTDAVMREVIRINREINVDKQAADLDEINYWDDLSETLTARELADWDYVSLARDEGTVNFVVDGDAYEYAPYVFSGAFSNMKIDAAPFIPFVKPEYRQSFSR